MRFRYYMNSMVYDWWSANLRKRCEQADTYLCKIATANDPSDSEKLTTQTPAGKDTMTEIFGEREKNHKHNKRSDSHKYDKLDNI